MPDRSGITRSQREDYLVTVYFGRSSDFLSAAVNRAYRDAQRRADGISAFARHPRRDSVRRLVCKLVGQVKRVRTQAQFDAWHKRSTGQIKAAFRAIGYEFFTVGLAQKWLNMTLKYIFVLGAARVPGYRHLYLLCHVPLDNFVMTEAGKHGLQKLSVSWSRLDDYAVYMERQRWFRGRFDKPPLAIEFDLWLSHRRQEASALDAPELGTR